MTSKLLHAIVGVGISLGASSAGCFGATSGNGATSEEDGSGSAGSAGVAHGGSAASGASGSTAGGKPVTEPDAGTEPMPDPADAGIDPFCDMVWPTTKGNPKPPAECVAGCDLRERKICMEVISAPHHCDYGNNVYPHCVDGHWQCRGETTEYDKCRCWGTIPEGHHCTENGLDPPVPEDV